MTYNAIDIIDVVERPLTEKEKASLLAWFERAMKYDVPGTCIHIIRAPRYAPDHAWLDAT